MSARDGGAAFPSPGVVLSPGTERYQQGAYEGMTLRDYFAAKAMQGMLANDADGYSFISCAQAAYEQADAMLAERAKGEPV